MLNIYQQNNQPDDLGGKAKAETPKTTTHSDFRKYTDPTGELRSKELERGIWFVSHLVWIYRLIVLVLVLLNVMVWMTGLIKWGIFFVDWETQTKVYEQLSRFPNYTTINKRLAPADLQILDADILPGGVDRYDAVAEVANTNHQFMVKFDYYFLVNGSSTEKGEATLLPTQSRPIAILGLKGYDLGDAVLVIEKPRWTRLNRHKYPDAITYQKDRLDFSVSNFVFTPAQVGDGLAANVLAFDVTNNSPYSYIEPTFTLGLYNGEDNLVGVTPLTVPSIAAGETKKIDIRNFVRDFQVSEVQLFPHINVYDKEAYRAP